MQPIELAAGNSRLGLAPSKGGVVTHWRMDEWDVLRPASPDSDAPVDSAAFPLVPFSGRISKGRFRFGGRDVSLRANFLPEPHAIHGQGWQSTWRVSSVSPTSATLSLTYDAGDWPWAYEATQLFELYDDHLKVTLKLRNESDRAMPAGLGWHPYFRLDDAEIEADVESIWISDDGGIPDTTEALGPGTDIRSARRVSDLSLDHAFALQQTAVRLSWPLKRRRILMLGDPLFQNLIVYTPPGEPYFCVEPVSHAPNAVNSSKPAEITGLRILQPGYTIEGSIVLRVEAL